MFVRPLLRILSKDKLSVFLFHKVPALLDPLTPSDCDLRMFELLLERISRDFRVIPLTDAVDCLRRGTLPPCAACITFDDGYPDWLTGAVPALVSRNLHATFFITSGQFDGVPLWHERIHAAVRGLPGPILDLDLPFLPPASLVNMDDRCHQVQRLEQELKYLTLQRREEIIVQLENLAGISPLDVPVMKEPQLRDLHSKGFGVGAHTALHPILDYCSADEATREIGGARERIQAIVRGPVDGFAYPNGRPYADFSRLHVEAVKRAGYQYAVTTHWGVADATTSLFQIPRFTPWAERDLHVTFQLARNLLTKPMQVAEAVV